MPVSRWIDDALAEVPRGASGRAAVAFALTFAACAVALAAVLFALGRPRAGLAVLGFGAAGAAVSLVPRIGPLFQRAWLLLGVLLGRITSPVVLAVVYFGLVTPLALLRRRFGPDPMRRAWDEGDGSYWEEYADPVDPRRYFRQY